MNTQVLLFLGKAALLTIAFVLMYRLLLRRETFHGLKRGALLLSLVLSYVLPVTVITVHRDIRKNPVAQTVASAQPAATPINQIQPFSPVAQTIAPAPSVSATENAAEQAPTVHKDKTAVLFQILLAAYLAGLIVMLLLRVRSILKVSAIVRGGETVERGDGYRIVVTDKNVSPFSWLGTIVVSQKEYAGIDSNVLRHEKAHIAHGHPLELMLLDFMSLFQWFNPAVWVLRRDLCLVHEQQADADVLNSLSDARPYQFMLLSQSQGGLAFNIVASFNGNGVESRIDMMNRKRSGRRQMIRFLYLPVVMCVSLTMSANVAYDRISDESIVPSDSVQTMVINGQEEKFVVLDLNTLTLGNEHLGIGRKPDNDLIYIVDGKIVDRETVNNIRFLDIKNQLTVIDKAATDLYGPEAVNGVKIIETKESTITDPELVRSVASKNTKTTHEYVDLGLSIKWATCNVGADKPEENGILYAWGETEPKNILDPRNWMTGKWGNVMFGFTKYNTNSEYGTVDNKTTLDPEDDVAHVIWGGKWRMPTKQEMVELLDNCTWEWTTLNGVNGYRVTSKKQGYTNRSIFLPAAGHALNLRYEYGSRGSYWSSTIEPLNDGMGGLSCHSAAIIDFSSRHAVISYGSRESGYSIRPVCP